MYLSKLSLTACCVILSYILVPNELFAHNGKIAYAYPLGKITVDGDLSDWSKTATKYLVNSHLSDNRPKNDADFNAFFQIGYRVEERSLYIAFTIVDEDFIQDTSQNVQWNTQDGLEICLDARHLASRSGVASFMYSKKLRNTNLAAYDPFAKNAGWHIMEVAFTQKGSTRFYEWRILLNDELVVGKSIGFDFTMFDKDGDGSFTFMGWGMGGMKFRDVNSLGDVVLLPANQKLGTVSGSIRWDSTMKERLPIFICIRSIGNPRQWMQLEVDTTGSYETEVPAGTYELMFLQPYFTRREKLYSTIAEKDFLVVVKPGQKNRAPERLISSKPMPSLIPQKGLLQDFDATKSTQVDRLMETYMKYYNIPGASLALIKDGKLAYYKTYGVRNAMTGEKVDDQTLFEAASVTKPVFAYAVQRLAERGIIDLDKPLYQYLPYKDIENDERYKLITAKHVLTHRTGFPNWRSMNEDGKLNIRFTPGTSYGYSGEGFEYLKMVIEKITGKKVEQVLQEEVIVPMGLYHTFFSRNDSLKRMASNGHYNLLPTYDELNELPGMAWSMQTEAKIFTRFMLHLLEQKGLSTQTYETMFSKQSEFNWPPDREKPKYPEYMGMSLAIRESPFGKVFGHSGNNGDFKCAFEVYKDLKMGYVVFTNSNTSDILLENLAKLFVEGSEGVGSR